MRITFSLSCPGQSSNPMMFFIFWQTNRKNSCFSFKIRIYFSSSLAVIFFGVNCIIRQNSERTENVLEHEQVDERCEGKLQIMADIQSSSEEKTAKLLSASGRIFTQSKFLESPPGVNELNWESPDPFAFLCEGHSQGKEKRRTKNPFKGRISRYKKVSDYTLHETFFLRIEAKCR